MSHASKALVVMLGGLVGGLAGCSSSGTPFSAQQVTNAKASVKNVRTLAKATPQHRRQAFYHTFEAGPGMASLEASKNQQYQPPAGWAGLLGAFTGLAPK